MIIEIDGGRYEKLDEVKNSVVRQGVRHLVLWDQDCRNHRRYGIRSWPIAYLIGRDGKVLWEGRPLKAMTTATLEQTIVDKRTGRRLRDLVAKALSKSYQARIASR